MAYQSRKCFDAMGLPFLGMLVVVVVFVDAASGLDRTWIGGNTPWDADSSKWNPNDEPDADDRAVFITPDRVVMVEDNSPDGTNDIGALTLGGGMHLFTSEQFLDVGGLVSLAGNDTVLQVASNQAGNFPTTSLAAYDITINSGATLLMAGEVEAGDPSIAPALVDINAGGTLAGNGRLLLNDSLLFTTTQLINDGTIRARDADSAFLGAPPAHTLILSSVDADARVDLDGTGEGGGVEVSRNQTLDVNIRLSDAFSGQMNLFHNATFDVSTPWTFDGTMTVDNGFVPGQTFPIFIPPIPADVAYIDGAEVTMTGAGALIDVVDGDGTLQFDAPFTANAGTIRNDGLIVFNEDATIDPAVDFQMPTGTSSLEVNAPVIINDANFDWDGAGTANNITSVGPDGFLNLNLSSFDGNDGYDGSIALNGGVLTASVADGEWSFGSTGTFDVNGPGGSNLDGSTVRFFGTLNVNAGGLIADAELLFAGGSNLNVAGGSSALLTGDVTFFNGSNIQVDGTLNLGFFGSGETTWVSPASVVGDGVIRQSSPANVTGDTAIEVATYVWDHGPTTITPTGSLTLDVDNISDDSIFGFDDTYDSETINVNGSTLSVTVADGSWTLGQDGVLNLINDTTGLGASVAAGSEMRVASGGLIRVTGNNHVIDTPLVLEESSEISMTDSGARLALIGGTELAGGDINQTVPGATVSNGSPLIVTGDSTINVTTFNWDLAPTTIVPGGHLTLNVDSVSFVDNAYYDRLTINSGEVDINTASDFVIHGTVNLNNTTGTAARIETPSGPMGVRVVVGDGISGTLNATINVGGTGTSSIVSFVEFNSDADVNIAAGATLATSIASFDGGRYTGGGRFRPTFVVVNNPTTWDVALVDLDSIGEHRINADLTINADVIDDGSGGSVDADIVIADQATLTANVTSGNWAFDTGTITYNGDDSTLEIFLAGSDLELGASAVLEVNGVGRSDARLDIFGTVNVTDPGDIFVPGSPNGQNINRLRGGLVDGDGRLEFPFAPLDLDIGLLGFGTINADVRFGNLLADDGTMVVSGEILNVGQFGTFDSDGSLNVTNPWNTNQVARVILRGGELIGATITNDGISGINGWGEVTAPVVNNTLIRADRDSTMIYSNPQSDWDGTTNSGEIWAEDGNIELRDDAPFIFSGVVRTSLDNEVFANGFELEFAPNSQLILGPGTYRSTHATDFHGALHTAGIAGLATINVAGTFEFEANSETTLGGNLLLDNAVTVIHPGATFTDATGVWSLINLTGRTLRLLDGANVDVTIRNRGTTSLGLSPGQASGLEFIQPQTGTLQIELEGTGAEEFDSLDLTAAAQLDGELEVVLLGGFTPTLGDSFEIITAAAGVTGTFATETLPTLTGLAFDVIYNPNSVLLSVVLPGLPGDYNLDGTVNAADYVVWRDNVGAPSGTLPNDSTGGVIGQAQYDIWKGNFGATSGIGSSSASGQVPAPASVLLLILGSTCGICRGPRVARRCHDSSMHDARHQPTGF